MSLRNCGIFLLAAQISSSNVPNILEAQHCDGVFGHHLSRMTNSLNIDAFPLITAASPLTWLATATFQMVSCVGSSGAGCSPPHASSQRSMLALLH
jgi:hypothetical protein